MSTYLNTAREVAAAITDVLQTINQANGYETNIGQLVHRGRLNIADNMVPCAVLHEGADLITSRPGRLPQNEVEQTYVIAAYVPCHKDFPNDAAHAAVADVKKALFGSDVIKKKVKALTYQGKDVGARADGVPIVMATVEIKVTYVENLGNT